MFKVEDKLKMREVFKKKNRQTIVEEVVRCHGDLFSFSLFKTKNRHDAQDLVSEAVIRFFNSYDKGTSNYEVGTNILGYLKLIVVNLLRDRKRKERKSPNVIPLYREIDGEEIPNFNEYESQRLEKDVESLKDPYALHVDFKKTKRLMNEKLSEVDNEIFYLRYAEKYKYSEIAKKLKIKQGTVGSRINRSKKIIEQELKKINVIKAKENKNED